ncbi:hypothetical protein BDK51DRAFT_31100, partial [Blyttiomyces helicus]
MNVYPTPATSSRLGGIGAWNTPYGNLNIASRMPAPLATCGPLGVQSPLAACGPLGVQSPLAACGSLGVQPPLSTWSSMGMQSPPAIWGTTGMRSPLTTSGTDIQCIIHDVLTDRTRDMRNDALITELLDHRRLNRNIDDVIADISAGCYVHPQQVAQALIEDAADNLATDVAINAVIADRVSNRRNDRVIEDLLTKGVRVPTALDQQMHQQSSEVDNMLQQLTWKIITSEPTDVRLGLHDVRKRTARAPQMWATQGLGWGSVMTPQHAAMAPLMGSGVVCCTSPMVGGVSPMMRGANLGVCGVNPMTMRGVSPMMGQAYANQLSCCSPGVTRRMGVPNGLTICPITGNLC